MLLFACRTEVILGALVTLLVNVRLEVTAIIMAFRITFVRLEMLFEFLKVPGKPLGALLEPPVVLVGLEVFLGGC